MTDLSYRTQTNWFSRNKLACHLREDGLNCYKGWSRSFAYDEIDEIRIICFWSRFGVFSAQLMVHGRGGKVTIPSYTEESLGLSECRADTFIPFAESLVERVRAANPNAVFTTGSTSLWAVNMVVAATVAILGLFMTNLEIGGWPVFMAFGIAGGLALYAFKLGFRRKIGADALLAMLHSHVGPLRVGRTSARET